MDFIAVFLCAWLGAYVADRIRLPAAPLLGGLIVTSFFSLHVFPVNYNYEIKFVTRVLSGIMIGLRINREDTKMLKTVWKPLLFLSFGMIFYSTFLAYILSTFTQIDLTTALFACVPGGMADISLMAEDYGADMPQVALVQLLRLVCLMFFYPFLATNLAKKEGNLDPDATIPKKEKKKISWKPKKLPEVPPNKISDGVITFLLAGIGSFLFAQIGLPAGELLGAMTITLFRKLKFESGFFYQPLRFLVQITVGIMIGSTITPDTIDGLVDSFAITLIAVFFILMFGVVMGRIIQKIQGTDPLTSLLAVAPGGVQEMVLLSDSLGGNVSFVTTLQVFRLLIVFSVFPLWISFLLSIIP